MYAAHSRISTLRAWYDCISKVHGGQTIMVTIHKEDEIAAIINQESADERVESDSLSPSLRDSSPGLRLNLDA